MINEHICFIGGGNIATSIISRLILSKEIDPHKITVLDPNGKQLKILHQRYGQS